MERPAVRARSSHAQAAMKDNLSRECGAARARLSGTVVPRMRANGKRIECGERASLSARTTVYTKEIGSKVSKRVRALR